MGYPHTPDDPQPEPVSQPAVLLIGRWTPFHRGHQTVVNSFIDNGHRVVLAIRDTDYDAYTPKERAEIINAVYIDHVNPPEMLIIPDIVMVGIGRGVGYGIVEVPEDIQKISATDIRAGRDAADDMDPRARAAMELIDVDKNCADGENHRWVETTTMEDFKRTHACTFPGCGASKEVERENS